MDNKFSTEMNAWMMIQVIGKTSIYFLNKGKLAKEVEEHLEVLEKADLKEFSSFFIDSCLGSKAYTTAVFGTLSMSSAGAATRLAKEIDEVMGTIPEKLGLSQKSEPIRQLFLESFREKVDGAQKILDELGIK
jgi:hypothetical protein